MSRKAILKESILLITVVLATVGIAWGIIRLRAKFDPHVADELGKVSLDWEKKFKRTMLKYVRSDAAVVTEPVVVQAVDSILGVLLSGVDSLDYDIDVLTVRSATVNAVAFPGGLIIVFTPLLRSTDCPEQLAAVLAHEVGHVVKRDPARRMVRQLGIRTVLSMLGGGDATVFVERVLDEALDAHYTREQEDAADDFAIDLLDRSGIDPAHFADIMQKFKTGTSDDPAREVEKYFATHPDIDSRIAKARSRGRSQHTPARRFDLDWPAVKRALPSLFAK